MIYKVNISIQLLLQATENKPDVEGLTRDIFDAIKGKDETITAAWQTRPNVHIIDYSIDSEKVI